MKKTVGLIICYVVVVCSACTSVEHVDKEKIHKEAEQWMECIVKEDKEALLKYFASDIRDNDKEKTLKEIETAFEFIDGKIVSYAYAGIYGEEEHLKAGKVTYHCCCPEFQEVVVENGKKYIINFTYDNIWKERPEYKGLTKIVISKVDETSKEETNKSTNILKEDSTWEKNEVEQEDIVIGRNIYYDD